QWVAVGVDTGSEGHRTTAAKELTARNLQFAEQLGAETHTLIGRTVADAVLDYARESNVTKIIAGKTAQPGWRRWTVGTVVDQLLEKSGDIDIYVITGEGSEAHLRAAAGERKAPVNWLHYALSLAAVTVCGLAAWVSRAIGWPEANTVMI